MVPLPAEYRDCAFALEIADPSMNQIYPPGSCVVCVPMEHFRRDLLSHDKVIIRRHRNLLYEDTIREIVYEEGGRAWLWPRSSDPHHQTPTEVPAESSDDAEIEILAVVIGSYRPEPM